MITVLKAHDYKRMPWKNGGGETIEIAAFPEGSTLDTFQWRISMASVAADGPFSEFANIDRTLTVLTGEGMSLRIGRMTYALTPETPPLAFSGDAPTYGTLVNGPITDLNVMTRRGVFTHQVERLSGVSGLSFRAKGDLFLLIPMGPAVLSAGDETVPLQATDCACINSTDLELSFQAPEPVPVFCVSLEEVTEN